MTAPSFSFGYLSLERCRLCAAESLGTIPSTLCRIALREPMKGLVKMVLIASFWS